MLLVLLLVSTVDWRKSHELIGRGGGEIGARARKIAAGAAARIDRAAFSCVVIVRVRVFLYVLVCAFLNIWFVVSVCTSICF